MKRIISLALALLMLMSLFSVSVFAEEEEKSETIGFERTNNKETRHFILTAQKNDDDGWYAGNGKTLTITSKYNSIIITRVEAVIGEYGSHYGFIQTDGTKRETGEVNNGDTVHIDNIDSNTFSVSNWGKYYIEFKDITVFYKEVSHTHSYNENNTCINCGLTKCEAEGHSYNENNTCINCGLTKCEIEGHSYNKNNTCINCGLTKCEAEGHSYNENNTCINCGLTKCEIEGHSYKHGFCTFCGHKYEEELFETIGFETTDNKETAHFNLTAQGYDGNGWYGGYNYFPLTITAKDSNIIITRVEADVGFYGDLYHKVGASKGDKRENGPVNDGDTVHIDNINSNTFSFSGGTNFIQFKDITVFYEYTNGTGSTLSEGNTWIIAGIGVVAVVAIAVVIAKKKKAE